MFIDARQISEGAVIEADVFVVGAGAAGITLALDLADGARRIAVAESGGFEFSQETQQLYDGDVIGVPFPPLTIDRLRYLGGSTNHWSGSCRPFDAIDFERRDYVANSGWPFGRDELDPFYPRAHELCQLGPYTYNPLKWRTADAQPLDFGSDAALYTGIYQNGPPTRFGEAYRRDLATARNLSVYLNANLVDIETDESGTEVTGLALACFHGPRLRAHAKLYILACGAIENARLLLNANRVQSAGLGNRYDLVGRYFMDHPRFADAATILLADDVSGLAMYDGFTVNGQAIQGYLCPTAAVQRREALPNCCIILQRGELPEHDLARASLASLWKAVKSGYLPDHLFYHVGQVFRGVEFKVERTYDRWLHAASSLYSTTFMCECPPDRDSRVTLGNATDALGLRRVRLDWRLPPDIGRYLHRAHELLAQELGRHGLGRLSINMREEDAAGAALNGHHHMGTTRMHPDPKLGVVDANCRVHGMANLFVAGSSIFPAYSFDDPTMTIVALALRLSRHLKTATG